MLGEGQFNRSRPLSREYGYDRGTPIDRYYIEQFLQTHSADVRGRVLEVGDDIYSRRFGGAAVTRQDVLHVRAGSKKATLVGDLTNPATLPNDAFDCIILTQTLHLIFDMPAVVEQLHRALRSGGVVLITVPGVSSVERGEWRASWCWSLTETAVGRLLTGPFDEGRVELHTYGNLFSATAFLHGACVEEIDTGRLKPIDTAYPVTVGGRAWRQ